MTMACDHADTTIQTGRFGTWPRGILKAPSVTPGDLNYEPRPAGEVVPIRRSESPPPEDNAAGSAGQSAARRAAIQASGNGGSGVITVRRSVKFHLTDEQIGERDTLSRYRKRERGGWTGWFTHWKRLLAAVLQRMQPTLTTPSSTPSLRLSVSALGWAWETQEVDPAPWRISPPPLSPEGFDRLDLGRCRWAERERPSTALLQGQAWAEAGECLARHAAAALSEYAAAVAMAAALLVAWYFGLRGCSQKQAQRAPALPAGAQAD